MGDLLLAIYAGSAISLPYGFAAQEMGFQGEENQRQWRDLSRLWLLFPLVARDPQETLLLRSLVTRAVAHNHFLHFWEVQICGPSGTPVPTVAWHTEYQIVFNPCQAPHF